MVAIASLPAPARSLHGPRRPLVSVPPRSRSASPVRARAALTVVLVAVALLAATLLARTPPVSATGAPAVATHHVVEEGESMWSIAREHAPAGEAAVYVERVVEANGGAGVAVGQVVVLPVP